MNVSLTVRLPQTRRNDSAPKIPTSPRPSVKEFLVNLFRRDILTHHERSEASAWTVSRRTAF